MKCLRPTDGQSGILGEKIKIQPPPLSSGVWSFCSIRVYGVQSVAYAGARPTNGVAIAVDSNGIPHMVDS